MTIVALDAPRRRGGLSLGRAIGAVLARWRGRHVLRPETVPDDRLRDLGLLDGRGGGSRGDGVTWGK